MQFHVACVHEYNYAVRIYKYFCLQVSPMLSLHFSFNIARVLVFRCTVWAEVDRWASVGITPRTLLR